MGRGSQETIRVRPAEFIRTKQTKREVCTSLVCKEKIPPVLEPYNSVSPRSRWESELSRVGPPGVGRVELVDLP